MVWYIWFLIGLWAGGTAGLLLACLLHCSKEADERAALLMRIEKMGHEKLELLEHPKKYGLEEVGI